MLSESHFLIDYDDFLALDNESLVSLIDKPLAVHHYLDSEYDEAGHDPHS